MNCARCGSQSPDRAKFCLECGAAFATRCASCGTELPPAAKFCLECGAKVVERATPLSAPRDYTPKHLAEKILTSRSALEGERKQVTVLFADVKGSMDLAEQVDPEEWHKIMDRFFAILSEGVHRFEARLTSTQATASWLCLARRLPTRTMRGALATRPCGSRRSFVGTRSS
jgi:ribosomal protein L40E